ncbi:hypothetical protein HZH68_000716 [Vespula germanica]|uniref:Uncharacterized protein n=1 Tax=Vespula germanica TaxID=30212 RepID=A0A834NU98_VESGE|nr:hypothetical protein HZH68_000716 [Vespula germanica]
MKSLSFDFPFQSSQSSVDGDGDGGGGGGGGDDGGNDGDGGGGGANYGIAFHMALTFHTRHWNFLQRRVQSRRLSRRPEISRTGVNDMAAKDNDDDNDDNDDVDDDRKGVLTSQVTFAISD